LVSNFRYAHNLYFQDGQTLTAILTGLAYLIVAVSMDAAGYVDSLSILIPVTLGALGLGLLMSYSRFDGFFALSHSMFAGLAWILYLMSGLVEEADITAILSFGIPEVQAKIYFILLQLLNWLDDARNNQVNADNYVFIFEICLLVWWLTYLGVWSIMRHGYTWRAIIPAGLVLLINTYYSPASIIGFLVVFTLIVLILLIRTNLAEQQLRWRENRIYFNPDITFDFLRNGFYFSAAVLAFAMIAPGLGRNLQVRGVLAPINQQWQETTQEWNRLYEGLNRRQVASSAAFGRSLRLGGARDVGNRIIFQADSALGRYWRAVVFDTYDGRQWYNTSEDQATFETSQPIPVGDWQMRQFITQTITLRSATGRVVFGPPDIYSVDLPLDTAIRTVGSVPPIITSDITGPGEEDGAGLPVELTLARSTEPLENGSSYTVVSYHAAITELALREARTVYPPIIEERYLQLPENFSTQVSEMARTVTAGYETVYDKTKALEGFLRTNYQYNEEISAPPPDRDPVEYFLYEIRQGYCDYYATSMAVMLRSLGIPARTVSGYAEGVFDEEIEQYLVTERDAHTWVEVYFPDFGWIEFEPTAGESPLNRPSGTEPTDSSSLAPNIPNNPNDGINPGENPLDDFQDPALDNLIEDEPPFFTDASTTLAEQPWWVWGLLTPLLLIIGVMVLRFIQVRGPTAFTPDLPPILYERLQLWATRLGFPLRQEMTPYEQSSRLGRSIPEGKGYIQSITENYVQYRFSNQSAILGGLNADGLVDAPLMSGQAETPLTKVWQRLEPLFWKAWARKIFRRFIPGRRDPFALQK